MDVETNQSQTQVNPEQFKLEARERSTEILSGWAKLQGILISYEPLIRKRWMKKSKAQRTTILTKAYPEISKKHRPDIEAYCDESDAGIEGVTKGESLLLLLDTRGWNHPRCFEHADRQSIQLGITSRTILPVFLPHYTMSFAGETPETFGCLIPWHSWGLQTTENVEKGLATLPGMGLLTLEIQQKLVVFLVRLCETILHDLDMTSLTTLGTLPRDLSPPTEKSEWPSLAHLCAEAPYRLPTLLTFDRLKQLVDAKITSVEHYIWDIREDPAAFVDALMDEREHRYESVQDRLGATHFDLNTLKFWGQVIKSVIYEAQSDLILWNFLGKQLDLLAVLQEKYSAGIDPQKHLPADYLKAILKLRYCLDHTKGWLIFRVTAGVPCEPAYRSMFYRRAEYADNVPPEFSFQRRHGKSEDTNELLDIVNDIWSLKAIKTLGLYTVFDELDHFIEGHPKEKAKLSSWIMNRFSDLGILAHLINEVNNYFPWSLTFEVEEKKYTHDFAKDLANVEIPLKKFEDAIEAITASPRVIDLGTPTSGIFDYPCKQRRTKTTTEKMRKAEKSLDAFWQKIDHDLRKATGTSLRQRVQEICGGIRELERTPEWIEQPKAPKQAHRPNLLPSQNSAPIINPANS
ncbi:hypothetical protein SBOR_5476 [Sclerotinia borealis F-4128]|uniref:Uncharacterized protein n=1 Tax=Sclerotinia borealis (strain F-4128) TaxID=1432307 RepID=W9CBI7_SCLBF|nr:hypothetical protein SBOR_5476 [Sclerotinia borealis F-4128]